MLAGPLFELNEHLDLVHGRCKISAIFRAVQGIRDDVAGEGVTLRRLELAAKLVAMSASIATRYQRQMTNLAFVPTNDHGHPIHVKALVGDALQA